jgi:hypothetical protein
MLPRVWLATAPAPQASVEKLWPEPPAHALVCVTMRFRVQPRDVSKDAVVRRLSLTDAAFDACALAAIFIVSALL